MSYGLSLAGGGTRGAAHVGLLKALKEENLLPDAISGTSAGSIIAGLYAAGMDIDEMCEVIVYLSKHGKYLMDLDLKGLILLIPQMLAGRPASLTGLIKGNRLVRLFCGLVGDMEIGQVPMRLVIPAVDLKTGNTIVYTNSLSTRPMEHVVWERQGRLCEIIMASCSVPAVFQPRHLGNYCLVDGGVSSNLPVDLLIAAGVRNIVAADIGEDYETPHDTNIMEIASHSFSIMSRNLKDCMSSGERLLLKPQLPKGAGLLTFRYMADCMEAGYQYGKQHADKIRRIMGRYA